MFQAPNGRRLHYLAGGNNRAEMHSKIAFLHSGMMNWGSDLAFSSSWAVKCGSSDSCLCQKCASLRSNQSLPRLRKNDGIDRPFVTSLVSFTHKLFSYYWSYVGHEQMYIPVTMTGGGGRRNVLPLWWITLYVRHCSN